MATVDTDIERLETILREFREPVVVCDANALILLYNSAAKRLFHNFDALGLGQSLYRICARAPIDHTLRMLKHRTTDRESFDPEDTDARFVCATIDGEMLLHCHVSQITSGPGRRCVFVFTFEDVTSRISETGRQGYLLDKMIRDLRAPLANLNTAAENLRSYPEMAAETRSDFEAVIIKESAELTQRFEEVARESEKIASVRWPLFDVYSADLIGFLTRRFAGEEGVTVTMTGVPLWLHGDSYTLALALERFVSFVSECRNVSEFDIETLLGDRRVCIDIVWPGDPIPQAEIDSMLEETVPDAVSGITLAEILARHDSEIWSQRHHREGFSLLRIPVPDSPRQWETPPKSVPERLEFYDFSIAGSGAELGDRVDRSLSSLNYVVFDTETTGLRPGEGDEILSIAAVRIVNGRILSGERFERLIRPRRPIPESSLPFLEITEEMVRDEPPARVVLPKFKSFVNDLVLVSHNPGFDMHFFRSQEEAAGVVFDNPVLDTLLMAIVVDSGRTDYTLDAIARSLDIDVMKGQPAMDDCFTTAQVFLRLLELLEERGITTLGQIITASEKVAGDKRRQAAAGPRQGGADA